MRPCLPTALEMRPNSRTIFSLSSITWLRASAILPSTPVPSKERRAEKSPLRNAVRTFRMSRLSNASAGVTKLRALMGGISLESGVFKVLSRLWARGRGQERRLVLECVCQYAYWPEFSIGPYPRTPVSTREDRDGTAELLSPSCARFVLRFFVLWPVL